MGVYYLDTSALVKLVVAEAETPALMAWVGRNDTHASSDLARTELFRAVRRVTPDRMVAARDVLDRLLLITLTSTIMEHAGILNPAVLRSLDAVHLAAAMILGDELDGLVTYDDRLAEAASAHGIRVVAPA
ncbi:MAG: type II toxin-antitoxin system VapC family toxin [Cellulomonadaceae bacterium]|jgi:predicted nucleic acid-binding protein|nr:type II toxin-antitoxin system VapC family toxin [Cellulomonadaceae bacterium]